MEQEPVKAAMPEASNAESKNLGINFLIFSALTLRILCLVRTLTEQRRQEKREHVGLLNHLV
jgi:hypothetical protein